MTGKKTLKKTTNMVRRPPIVAVLGHVDHGKTTLLDTIRNTSIAKREFGGITQHIGAYQVAVGTKDGNRLITFIDTPGHEAFTKIRSRGADLSDIALLVVSLTDGIQPQTIESIRLIKEAKIPFIVVVTKVDLDGDIELIKRDLAKNDVLVEGLGGDVLCLGVSAKTQKGIHDLLEMIVLISEMQNLENDPEGMLEAVVIEVNANKHRGVEVGAVVKNGTLKVGEEIYTETQSGKVKAIFTDQGESILSADPGKPCKILGFNQAPLVGEQISSSKTIKTDKITEEKPRVLSSSDSEAKTFKIILKVDSQNSLEAIKASLPSENLEIISAGLGEVSQNDIFLAKTTKSIIVGFNVSLSSQAEKTAKFERVRVKIYKIIYELLQEINEVVSGLNKDVFQEVLGKASVIAEFPFDKKRVAGVKIVEGRMARGDKVLINRNEEEIGRAIIKTIKQFKKDINRAEVGDECGLLIDPNVDFKVGDMIVSVQS